MNLAHIFTCHLHKSRHWNGHTYDVLHVYTYKELFMDVPLKTREGGNDIQGLKQTIK